MKKVINEPSAIVSEMCGGIVLAHPEIQFNQKYKFLRRKNLNPGKVGLISGGGSGHEPAHGGFVGKGMLDAAVCGDVFASPSQVQVYQAIKETASEKGTLLIIKNYSGDIMNFANAAYLAEMDGLKVESVKVNDDIAIEDSLYTVGRRGVAGTMLVHKIAGAAAEMGSDLAQVKAAAEKAIANVRSIGFAFSSCTVPAKGTPTFELGDGEMEYGIGIHGEPGIKKEPATSADELANRMIPALLADLGIQGKSGQEVALLVNGFGSTPLMELYILANMAVGKLVDEGISVYRVFVGNYMTSLDMAGASLSILKLDDELKTLLDAPSEAPGFTVGGPGLPVSYTPADHKPATTEEACFEVETPEDSSLIRDEKLSLDNIIYIVDHMSKTIIENEVPFCDLDSHAGDGDFGMSVAKGFRQLKREWKNIIKNAANIGDFLDSCSVVIMEHCGGASGPIWGVAFKTAAKKAGSKNQLDIAEFAAVMQAAVDGVQAIGERSFGRGAVVGDKTLIDALAPCADAWAKAAADGSGLVKGFGLAAQAAVDGAKSTEGIVARMGRAGTVGQRSLGYPDAGAHALGVIFTEIAGAVKQG